MDDTVLLANLGWRGVNGLTPVLDFEHFYGGVTAQFVTWAFQLFGTDYLSINYAFVMMFLASGCVLWALCWQRLTLSGLVLLTALCAALLLSLAPIELGWLISPVLAHSFVYNHTGIILMMGLTVFALGTAKSNKIEYSAAVLAGITLYVLALLKPTFLAFAPCLILVSLLQARWRSTGLILVGTGLGVVVLDPSMDRFWGSLDVLLNSSAAERAGLVFFAKNAVNIVHQQAAAVIIVMMILFLRKTNFIKILAVLILAGGYGATLLTMGGSNDLKVLPMLVVIALLSSSLSPPQTQTSPGPDDLIIKSLPYALAYLFIVPAVVSAIMANAILVIQNDSRLITAGPARNYTVLPWTLSDTSIENTDFAERTADIIINTPDQFTERDEYVMFADGIALLQDVPELAGYGIISNGRLFDFTMPLGSPPVASFPVWPTTNLAYFAGTDPLPEDVDAVMISLDVSSRNLLNRQLIDKMGTEFTVCRKSAIWTLYVRDGLPETLCTPVQ